MKVILLTVAAAAIAFPQTSVRFSADSGGTPASAYFTGPFPTNALAVSDAAQQTGMRVHLPSSNDACATQPAAVCSNSALLNQLDGFSINPRLMVCFSAPVDPATLPVGISLLRLNDSKKDSDSEEGAPVPVNRVLFDPATNCAFAKPAQVLSQQSRYLLLITKAVHDAKGLPVAPDPEFTSCRQGVGPSYCPALQTALARVPDPSEKVVAASLFTTMAVTSWLEQARNLADQTLALNLPAGIPATFPLSSLRSMTYNPANSGLPAQEIPLAALTNVGAVSFGLYFSPLYLNQSGPEAGTITTSPNQPTGFVPVSYHVFLPQKSHGKIPVVIYGHGTGDNQFGAPTFMASTLARNGFATLAFEITGHGFGSSSTVAVTTDDGLTSYELTPGRGVSLSPGAPIGPTDGCIVPGPVGVRDCVRQSAVDLFTLVHLIRSGALGLDLDPDRIYYVGQSLGSIYGTLLTAVDPDVPAAVLNGDGGTSVDISRLAITSRPLATLFLASIKNLTLLNVAAGLAPPEPYFHDAFNDNYLLPGAPPVGNTIAEAPADQAAFEAADWLSLTGDALAFASHLQTDPLPGVPPKHVLFQFGIGDLEVPNPTESAIVSAANAQQSTTIFNFPSAVAQQPELAAVEDPAFSNLPILPHRALSNPTIFSPGNEAERSVALALQQQTADFFASKGKKISDPDRYLTFPFTSESNLFVIAPSSLPEALQFLQLKP